MSQSIREAQPHDPKDLAADLLQQAEGYASNGSWEQAVALLAQAWALTSGLYPDLADAAAWELALLYIRHRAYQEAASWLGRVFAPLAVTNHHWPETRQALIQLCLSAAQPAAPAASAPSAMARPLPVLHVTNLGHFQIHRDGAALPPCRASNAVALFRFLLSRRRRLAHRDELVEVFWPGVPPARATHSLHVAVASLRRYLGPEAGTYVRFETGYYLLDPDGPINDDSLAFEQQCDQAERHWQACDWASAYACYAQAIAHYQGDYAAEERDMQWAFALRERLLARYLLALDRLGQLLLHQGKIEAALTYALQLLERDEYREDIHLRAIRCYVQLGRRGEALHQYERCAAILATDLGLEPAPEIQEFYERIRPT